MQNGTPAKSFLWKDAILLMLCFVVFGAGRSATQSTMDPASGGMSEVKLGHLALQKGNSNAVKSFGERMITDHTKASDDLRQIAGEESIQLPEDMPKKEQALYDRLSRLQGVQFDRAYAQSMVKDHKKDVKRIRERSEFRE
jgi:putative membrane protein